MNTIHKCDKEDKIDAMDKKLTKLDKVVMETANGDSLLSMAKHTRLSTEAIQSDVKALLTFQTVVETEREIKREFREKKARRQQWLIGLLVGTALTLLGMLIAIVTG
jgi:hypothetical protein